MNSARIAEFSVWHQFVPDDATLLNGVRDTLGAIPPFLLKTVDNPEGVDQ